jgi:hypothetical protein
MKLDQPAMPTPPIMVDNGCAAVIPDAAYHGFTKREYAAIHLCVPDSGNADLDAMIRRAQRERLAGKIVAAIVSSTDRTFNNNLVAEEGYEVADAVIAAGEGKHE